MIYKGINMKKNKLTFFIFILSLFVFIGLIVIFIIIQANKRISLPQYDFFEKTYSFEITYNDIEEETLKNELIKFTYEDDKIFAFIGKSSSYNIYLAHSLIRLSNILKDEDIKLIVKNKLVDSLNYVNIDALNILDLYHYLLIIKEFAYTETLEQCEFALQKYYDSESQLFFINSKNDFLNDKLMISFLIYKDLHNYIDLDSYLFESVFSSYYSQIQFLGPESGNTLYNAGGDILYILSELNLDQIDIQLHHDWFNEWENHFENLVFDSVFSIKIYADYIKIKRNFYDVENDYAKINDYFESLTIDDFKDANDYLVIGDILENVDLDRNEAVKNAVKEQLQEAAEDFYFNISTISIENTYYGIMLLLALRTPLKTDKINNLLDTYDKEIKIKIDQGDYSTSSKWLYYVLMIQKIIDDDPSIDIKLINDYLDIIFSNLSTEEINIQNLITCRYLVEICSNLKIGIKNKHKNKVNSLLKKYFEENKDNLWFSRITDLFIIDKILGTNVIYDEFVFEVESKLNKNGGTMDYLGGTVNTYNTYDFVKIYDLYDSSIININLLFEKKNYISTITLDNGLCPETADGEVTLKSIYCGSIIKNLQYGGNK